VAKPAKQAKKSEPKQNKEVAKPTKKESK